MISRIKKFLFENQGLGQKITKNTFWLFSGQLVGRLIRIAIVVYAARILGPSSWGAFSYAMSLVAFMTIFSDMGVSAIVTRESTRQPEKSNVYFSTAFFIKLALLVFGVAVLLIGAPYIAPIEESKVLLPLIAFVLIFDSLRNFGFAISRAKEKMQWEGINEILTNAAIALFGFLLLKASPTSRALAAGYALATGIGFFAIAWQLKSYFKNLAGNLDFSLVKPLIKTAWPFVLLSSLGAIMINTDMVMLGWLRTAEEVGFYSAAQRPIQLLYVLPALFAASLFPTFSRLANQNNNELKMVLGNALKISIFSALAIALIGISFGGQIIGLLFGAAYLKAILPFKILVATVLIIFPSALVSNAILAFNQQRKFIAFSLIGALGNVAFNILLIPTFGIIGCAFSTIFTQFFANAFLWRKLAHILKPTTND